MCIVMPIFGVNLMCVLKISNVYLALDELFYLFSPTLSIFIVSIVGFLFHVDYLF